MKIFILNPAYGTGFVRSQRWPARSRGRVQRHPDFLAIAAAVLEREGHDVKLLDAAALNIEMSKVRKYATDYKPQMSVIHTTTPSIYNDIKHADMLKELGSITVLVGAHASVLPEDTLRISDKIDYIARGEYDYILRDIASGVAVEKILGVTYRNNRGEIVDNENRPPIEDLDELPFPAWHHIDIHDYFDAGKLYPFVTSILGRGCPYGCTFCLQPSALYGRRYRLRSAGNVVDEIQSNVDQFPDLREVMFEDDTFTADKKRAKDICEEILRRNINISWSANARADLDDLDLMKLMKEAGCRMLVVGFEFGDQQILDNMHKKLTISQMMEFSALAKKVGLKIHGCFMVGGLGETCETANKTLKLINDLKPDTIQVSALTPYPGTPFYNICRENGYIHAKDWTEWVDSNEQSTVVSYPNLSRKEILEFVDKALYSKFYLKPSTWWHHLRTLENFGDFKRKVRAAISLGNYLIKSKFHSKNK